MRNLIYDPVDTDYTKTRHVPKFIRDRVAALVLHSGRRRVLDLGCGNGRFLSALEKSGRAVGLDMSAAMLGEYRRLSKSPTSLVRGNALSLPFPSEVFSSVLVVSLFQLFSAAELSGCLSEVARVLSPKAELMYGYTLYDGNDREVYEYLRFGLPQYIGDALSGATDNRIPFSMIARTIGERFGLARRTSIGTWGCPIRVADVIHDMAAGIYSESFNWLPQHVSAYRREAVQCVARHGMSLDTVLALSKRFVVDQYRDRNEPVRRSGENRGASSSLRL
jgi:SAM-dependent methyltransferase